MNQAPIVLFVYNRPQHTANTLDSLKQNVGSSSSDLYIYSDAPRKQEDTPKVQNVRAYLKTVSGFRKVTVIERQCNYGLAKNIHLGVTEVINQYGKAIIVEDDLVTSPNFLFFMNKALNQYQKYKKVWHISGWNYPVEINCEEDAFLWRTMNCWGWATWADRWQYFEKVPDKIVNDWDKKKIKSFNLDGYFNFFKQIQLNQTGKMNTWAVFWYATIFQNNGLCLNPRHSLVDNAGLDGSGENCSGFNIFKSKFEAECSFVLPSKLIENKVALRSIKRFCFKYKLSLPQRAWARLKTVLSKTLK